MEPEVTTEEPAAETKTEESAAETAVETPEVSEPEPETPKNDIDAWLADQGLEPISEEDLKGYEEEEEEESKEEKPAEPEKPEPAPPKAEDKPPKGFVPTKAVQEAREENRFLKEKLKELEETVESLKAKPSEPKEVKEGFKVLSKAEFQELSEESPQEALVYMLELQEHKEQLRQAEQQEKERAQTVKQIEQTLTEAQKAMEEVVPGIFDEGSGVQEELATFAESIGFTEELFYLTNPETLVILPGETTPSYLGKQAASILKMIVNMKNKSATADDTALRKKIEAEVLSKLKSTSPGKEFKSLSDLPSSEPVKPGKTGPLTEAEMAKMSDAELERYLSGE